MKPRFMKLIKSLILVIRFSQGIITVQFLLQIVALFSSFHPYFSLPSRRLTLIREYILPLIAPTGWTSLQVSHSNLQILSDLPVWVVATVTALIIVKFFIFIFATLFLVEFLLQILAGSFFSPKTANLLFTHASLVLFFVTWQMVQDFFLIRFVFNSPDFSQCHPRPFLDIGALTFGSLFEVGFILVLALILREGVRIQQENQLTV